MSEATQGSGGAGPSHRTVEIAVAAVIALFGLIAILGARRVGTGWGAEGPQAGFFPFYVGSFVIVASAINVLAILRSENTGKPFAEWGQLRQVAAVVAPTAVYVAIIPSLGIYVSSMLLIAVFMRWLGKYPWHWVVLVAIGMPVLTFFMFEMWFLVPLPKGPLETYLFH
jgi:putative tricarboxylic transport membrane protein